MNGQDEKHRWSWDWLKTATGVATHSPRLLGGFTQGKSLWEAHSLLLHFYYKLTCCNLSRVYSLLNRDSTFWLNRCSMYQSTYMYYK